MGQWVQGNTTLLEGGGISEPKSDTSVGKFMACHRNDHGWNEGYIVQDAVGFHHFNGIVVGSERLCKANEWERGACMFVAGNLCHATAAVLDKVLYLYALVVFIAVLIKHVSPDPLNPIVRFLDALTAPPLQWIRTRFPFVVVGRFDLSPIALLLGIGFVQMVVVQSLYELGARLR